MVNIKRKLIRKRKNTRPGTKQASIKAIVVHYTANPGATAENHYRYFNNGAGGRYASAHYFIDKNEVIQIIPDNETTFAANETGYSRLPYLQGARSSNGYKGNANSSAVHVEMCIEKDGSYHPRTLQQTKELVSHLMKKYNIPISRVVRHFDITGKNCPASYINSTKWNNFKSGIQTSSKPTKTQPTKNNIVVITHDTNLMKDGKVVRKLKRGSVFKFYNETKTHFDIGNRQMVLKEHSSRHKGTFKNTKVMNIRSKPSFDSKVVGKLQKGTWRAYDKKEYWINIGRGWVSNKDYAYGIEDWL